MTVLNPVRQGAEGKEGAPGPESWVNVKRYGALGINGNDTVAIDAAIAALKNQTGGRGGTLYFPYGQFRYTGEMNFDGMRSVRLVGVGGMSAGNSPASQLIFDTEGAGRCLSARSSVGFRIEDLSVLYASPAFTGTLIDLSHNGAEGDSAYFWFKGFIYGGLGIRTAVGMNLDKAIAGKFDGVYEQNCTVGVIGQAEAGSYSNAISFYSCVFAGNATVHTRNAGESWAFEGCTFEPLSGGAAGAYDSTAGVVSKSLSFTNGCWFGDVTAGAGTQIKFSGAGFLFEGNMMGGNAATTGIEISVTSTGIEIGGGNRWNTLAIGVNILAGAAEYEVSPAQNWIAVTKKVTVDGGTTDCSGGIVTDKIGDGQVGVMAPQFTGGAMNQGEFTLVAGVAYGARFRVPARQATTKIAFLVTTVAGSNDPVECGIYDAAGNLLATSGEQLGKLNAEGVQTVNVAVTLSPNTTYYAAIICKTVGTTGAKLGSATGTKGGFANLLGSGFPKAIGIVQSAIAALQNPFVSAGGQVNLPILAIRKE